MPQYTDREGRTWNLQDWPGDSYKARVINAAYRNRAFRVVNIGGGNVVLFRCFWCRKEIMSAGVEGDHVVQQSLGAVNRGPLREEMHELFAEAEAEENPDHTDWNLVLACSECNGGSRNKRKVLTRGDFRRDRDRQGPVLIV